MTNQWELRFKEVKKQLYFLMRMIESHPQSYSSDEQAQLQSIIEGVEEIEASEY